MRQPKSQSKFRSKRLFGRIAAKTAMLFVVFFLPFSLFAVTKDSSRGLEQEVIRSFTTYIELRADRSAKIIENIIYDFGTSERHGIFRDIPYRYKGLGGANDDIPLSDFFVTIDGEPEPFEVSRGGGEVHLKIGDPDITISGAHEYSITYTAKEITGSFDYNDEVYWNATGNDWPVPILSAEALVVLPEAVSRQYIQQSCYIGQFGSTERCDLSPIVGVDLSGQQFMFKSPRPLSSGEGMTVALGFPKAIVKEKTTADVVSNFVTANGIAILPLIIFVFMFRHWRRNGKDPKGRGVIIPQYDVPEKLSSLEIAGLMRQGVGANDISAGLIELAVLGYLKIEQIDEKILGIIPKKDYRFIERKQKDSALSLPESELLENLFLKSDKNTEGLREVKLSDLKKEFVSKIETIKKVVMESLVARGFYEKQPNKVIVPYILSGVGFLVLGGIMAASFENGVMLAAFAISGVIVFIFGLLMPKVTKEGALVKEKILGLKDYLQIAEKDRLKFHNAPQKRPEIFEKLLPFAMALHVEKAWAKEFEGIYTQNPSWYSGPAGHHFSAIAFTNDMHSFATATSTAVNPHSSSGSGGGGFSGGGGGGGGGGSW